MTKGLLGLSEATSCARTCAPASASAETITSGRVRKLIDLLDLPITKRPLKSDRDATPMPVLTAAVLRKSDAQSKLNRRYPPVRLVYCEFVRNLLGSSAAQSTEAHVLVPANASRCTQIRMSGPTDG